MADFTIKGNKMIVIGGNVYQYSISDGLITIYREWGVSELPFVTIDRNTYSIGGLLYDKIR